MSYTLPNVDPSLPSNVSPIFSDTDAARGDQMRANNNSIWSNFSYIISALNGIVSTILGNKSVGTSVGNIPILGTTEGTAPRIGSGGKLPFSISGNCDGFSESLDVHTLAHTDGPTQLFLLGAGAVAWADSSVPGMPTADYYTCFVYGYRPGNGGGGHLKAIAKLANSRAEYEMTWEDGGSSSWLQIKNSDGSVPNATHVLPFIIGVGVNLIYTISVNPNTPHFYCAGADYAPTASFYGAVSADWQDSVNVRLSAKRNNSIEQYDGAIVNGSWSGWTLTRNADGSVPNATNATNAITHKLNAGHTMYEASTTYGAIWTALSSSCTNTTTKIIAPGSIILVAGRLFVTSFAEYINSTTIRLYYAEANAVASGISSIDVISGDSTAVLFVLLAW